jgi:hypothetical protein
MEPFQLWLPAFCNSLGMPPVARDVQRAFTA